ncbi:MAG: S-adenosylmethionine synthetase [Syntrophus sp. PtaU1.Bin005]|jgi:S-adenosylmethionine synthetase|uniref:methionine adenosyltransferase n=1 Tax=Syntrophus sp. (in: bacteria) TaxID=48412 RepID=UPI0009CD2BE4|nr:MAG: S-adenosylmethionine synthetase [Syntrophus sp. PtaU1.Bin005]
MILVEPFKGKSATEHMVEIVERKGKGHPDYMCDSIMESISVALSREYIKAFGTVLHHNIDKGLLSAGRVEKNFGGGRVIKPMELTIGDRATLSAAGREIPVVDIAIDSAKQWIRSHMRFVDPDAHLEYRVVLLPGSEELTDIFSRPGRVMAANDTSAAVGYYPLSPTEKVVLTLEGRLNSAEFKNMHPETGEDIKVMGLRSRDSLDLTVAMPLLAPYIRSEEEYFERKGIIHRSIKEMLGETGGFKRIDVHFNNLDERGRGLGGIYLSLLGTSAEDADSGQVGRGNRVNGLISVSRPLGTEAAAGKNPVSHVGKIYNVLSHKIAREIYENIDGIKEVYVLLLSRIGAPVDRPQMATAQILLERGRTIGDVASRTKDIFETEFSEINRFCEELSAGKYPVC